jgi:hypothetical protein
MFRSWVVDEEDDDDGSAGIVMEVGRREAVVAGRCLVARCIFDLYSYINGRSPIIWAAGLYNPNQAM